MPRLHDALFGEIALRNALIGQTELQAAYDILEDRLAKGHRRSLAQILVENHLVQKKVAAKIAQMVAKLVKKKKQKRATKEAARRGKRVTIEPPARSKTRESGRVKARSSSRKEAGRVKTRESGRVKARSSSRKEAGRVKTRESGRVKARSSSRRESGRVKAEGTSRRSRESGRGKTGSSRKSRDSSRRTRRKESRRHAYPVIVAGSRRSRTQAVLEPVASSRGRTQATLPPIAYRRTRSGRLTTAGRTKRVAVTEAVLPPVGAIRPDRTGTVRTELTRQLQSPHTEGRTRARRRRTSLRVRQPSRTPFILLMVFLGITVAALVGYVASDRGPSPLERARAERGDTPPDRPSPPDRGHADRPTRRESERERRAGSLFREINRERDVYARVADLRNLAFDYADTSYAKRALDEAARLEAVATDTDLAVLGRALDDCNALLGDGRLGQALLRLEQVRSQLGSVKASDQLDTQIALVRTRIEAEKARLERQLDELVASGRHASADSALTVAALSLGRPERDWVEARREEAWSALRDAELEVLAKAEAERERYVLELLQAVSEGDFEEALTLVTGSDHRIAAIDRDALALMQQVDQLVLAGAASDGHTPGDIELRSGQVLHGRILGVEDGMILLRTEGSTMKLSPQDFSEGQRYSLAIHPDYDNGRLYKLGCALIATYSGRLREGLELLEELSGKGIEVDDFVERTRQLAAFFPGLDAAPAVAQREAPRTPDGATLSRTPEEEAGRFRWEDEVGTLFDPDAYVGYENGVVTLVYDFDGREELGPDWKVTQGRVRRDPMGIGVKVQRSGFFESEAKFRGDVAVEMKFYSNDLPEEDTRLSVCFRTDDNLLFEANYGLQVAAYKGGNMKGQGGFGGDPRDVVLVGDSMLMGLRSERGKIVSSLSGLDRSYIKGGDPLESASVCVMWQNANARVRTITITAELDPEWAERELRSRR